MCAPAPWGETHPLETLAIHTSSRLPTRRHKKKGSYKASLSLAVKLFRTKGVALKTNYQCRSLAPPWSPPSVAR
jgi:hypothetical protein